MKRGENTMADPKIIENIYSQNCSDCKTPLTPENTGSIDGNTTGLCKSCLRDELESLK